MDVICFDPAILGGKACIRGLRISVSLIVNLVLSLSLINVLGIAGLALANTVAALAEMVLLAWVLRSRLNGLDDRRVVETTLKTLAASIVMALGVAGFLHVTADAGVLVRAGGGMLIGAGMFAVAAWLLRVEELRLLAGLLGRRILGHG